MRRRVLDIAVCSADTLAVSVGDLAERTSQLLANSSAVAAPRFADATPSQSTSDGHHLVVNLDADGAPNPWVDVVIGTREELEIFLTDRIVPWAWKWAENRRAPRATVPVQTPSDNTWPDQANRLIGRLRHRITAPGLMRIDHIGSTSVPGLTAKNLIDIQILARTTDDARQVADQATAAGFSLVPGDWFGVDQTGARYPELVVVDSDPRRPVNCNIRIASEPVGREAILYRDWLRSNEQARNRYAALKARLVDEHDQHVDSYSEQKEPFINAALHEAEAWAVSTNWTL